MDYKITKARLGKLLIGSLGVFIFSLNSLAMMRTDVIDRSKEDVVKKSYFLGETLVPAKATCAICIDDQKWVSGVALDPWTILTSACYVSDMKYFFYINFSNNVLDNFKSGFTICTKPIVHKTFEISKTNKVSHYLSQKEDLFYIFNAPLEDIGSIKFEDFEDHDIANNLYFSGVDLAIIKLDEALSFQIDYPKILRDDFEKETKLGYGVSVGYGPMKYNFQDSPPQFVECKPQGKKHVISLNLNSFTTKNSGGVLYGDYEGLLVNGEDAFIPKETMLKTEGLPVNGDSGGGFFIEDNKDYYLAGICSQTKTFMSNPVCNLNSREKLKGFKQKMFPEFVDVRKHREWIEKHTGK